MNPFRCFLLIEIFIIGIGICYFKKVLLRTLTVFAYMFKWVFAFGKLKVHTRIWHLINLKYTNEKCYRYIHYDWALIKMPCCNAFTKGWFSDVAEFLAILNVLRECNKRSEECMYCCTEFTVLCILHFINFSFSNLTYAEVTSSSNELIKYRKT